MSGGEQFCARTARKQSRQMALTGAAALAGGVFATWFGAVTGLLWSIRDFLWIVMVFFLLAGGIYLLFAGLRGLARPETTDICTFIRAQLGPEADGLTGEELLALVDADLACAQSLAGGQVLVGQEWLAVRDAWARPIRLERICRIERKTTRRIPLYLNIMDERGLGPVTGRLSPAEAEAIEAYLNSRTPHTFS